MPKSFACLLEGCPASFDRQKLLDKHLNKHLERGAGWKAWKGKQAKTKKDKREIVDLRSPPPSPHPRALRESPGPSHGERIELSPEPEEENDNDEVINPSPTRPTWVTKSPPVDISGDGVERDVVMEESGHPQAKALQIQVVTGASSPSVIPKGGQRSFHPFHENSEDEEMDMVDQLASSAGSDKESAASSESGRLQSPLAIAVDGAQEVKLDIGKLQSPFATLSPGIRAILSTPRVSSAASETETVCPTRHVTPTSSIGPMDDPPTLQNAPQTPQHAPESESATHTRTNALTPFAIHAKKALQAEGQGDAAGQRAMTAKRQDALTRPPSSESAASGNSSPYTPRPSQTLLGARLCLSEDTPSKKSKRAHTENDTPQATTADPVTPASSSAASYFLAAASTPSSPPMVHHAGLPCPWDYFQKLQLLLHHSPCGHFGGCEKARSRQTDFRLVSELAADLSRLADKCSSANGQDQGENFERGRALIGELSRLWSE
ncbi:hypothetical protein P7C73_g4518, partial [Tremellales sp. Uapishka_1]